MEYEYGPDAGRAHSTGEREDGEMASCPVAEESKPLVGNDPENCEGAGDVVVKLTRMERIEKWRNFIGFWVLGLCNNFPYVIMLSAAFDILRDLQGNSQPSVVNLTLVEWGGMPFVNYSQNSTSLGRDCNKDSTSLILLADVFPTFVIKIFAPYFMHLIPFWIRVNGVVVVCAALSFVLVGLSLNVPLVIFGVVCASISSGFGEITFLSLTARYDKSTVIGWSSGTGAAGVGGALIYAGLTTFLSSRVTLFIQEIMPVIMVLTYFFVLGRAKKYVTDVDKEQPQTQHSYGSDKTCMKKCFDNKFFKGHASSNGHNHSDDPSYKMTESSSSGSESGCDEANYDEGKGDTGPLMGQEATKRQPVSGKERRKVQLKHLWENIKYIPHLWKYMLPLFFVYVAEYMINQGLYEILFYPGTHLGRFYLSHNAQYRWYQVAYQIGVLISRTSVALFYFKYFWILAVLQVVNFVFLYFEAVYLFMPFFWITLFIALYEGLLGGGVYANAFYSISKHVPEVHREFSMGVTSVSDSAGITVAAFLSIAIHNHICGLPYPH